MTDKKDERAEVEVVEESDTGLNIKVKVDGENLSSDDAYDKAKDGEIAGYHDLLTKDGEKTIRSNLDGKETNNIEK